MFRRIVEMELPGLEEVIVGLVGESDPGIVSVHGLDILCSGCSEGECRVLPIDLIALRWRTGLKILLAGDVNWRLPDVVAARAAPTALVRVAETSKSTISTN